MPEMFFSNQEDLGDGPETFLRYQIFKKPGGPTAENVATLLEWAASWLRSRGAQIIAILLSSYQIEDEITTELLVIYTI